MYAVSCRNGYPSVLAFPLATAKTAAEKIPLMSDRHVYPWRRCCTEDPDFLITTPFLPLPFTAVALYDGLSCCLLLMSWRWSLMMHSLWTRTAGPSSWRSPPVRSIFLDISMYVVFISELVKGSHRGDLGEVASVVVAMYHACPLYGGFRRISRRSCVADRGVPDQWFGKVSKRVCTPPHFLCFTLPGGVLGRPLPLMLILSLRPLVHYRALFSSVPPDYKVMVIVVF